MKRNEPRGGWPWLKPGFSFQIPNWPPGFVPQPLPRISEVERRASAAKGREKTKAMGITGAFQGMSHKADAQLLPSAAVLVRRAGQR